MKNSLKNATNLFSLEDFIQDRSIGPVRGNESFVGVKFT